MASTTTSSSPTAAGAQPASSQPRPVIGTFVGTRPGWFVRQRDAEVAATWMAEVRRLNSNRVPQPNIDQYVLFKLLLPEESGDLVISDLAAAEAIVNRLSVRLMERVR